MDGWLDEARVHSIMVPFLNTYSTDVNFIPSEEIGISAPDERELVLSEIYELDNPSEEEHLEAEIQGEILRVSITASRHVI